METEKSAKPEIRDCAEEGKTKIKKIVRSYKGRGF